jgi:hypothetical protein
LSHDQSGIDGGGDGLGGCNDGEIGGADGGAGCTLAKSTGSHCGGIATGWLTSANLHATLGFAVCGKNVAQKAVAAPMRTNAWKLEAACFA